MTSGIALLVLAGACLAVSAHAQDDGGDYFGGSGDVSDFGDASWGASSGTVVDGSALPSLSQGFLSWQPAPLQWQNGPSLADQLSSFQNNLQATLSNGVLDAAQWERNVLAGAWANPWGAGAAVVDFGVGVAGVALGNPALAESLLIPEGALSFISTGTSLVNSSFNDPSFYSGLAGAAGGESIALDNSRSANAAWTALGGLQSLQTLSALGASLSNPPENTFPVTPIPQLDLQSLDSQLLQLRRDAASADQLVQDAQAALDAQRASLNSQQGATDAAVEDLQLPTAANTPSPWPSGYSGQYQTATTADPIVGSWTVVGSRGCERELSTVPELRANGWNGTFTIKSQGAGIFGVADQYGRGGNITRVAPGTYTTPSSADWSGTVFRLNGATMQMSGTYHHTGPLARYVCTEVWTARKL